MKELRVVDDIGALTWTEHLKINELIVYTLKNSNNVEYTPGQLQVLCEVMSPKCISARLKEKSYGVFYEQDGEILGCGFGVVENEIIEGKALYVHPSIQGQGIGSRILSELEKKAKDLNARKICLQTDFPEFYLKRGYSVVDERIEEADGERFEYKFMCKEL